MKKKVLVSSCLLGLAVRYDGRGVPQERLIHHMNEGNLFFFCPEQYGGLPTPREPAEIEPGKTAQDVLDGTAKIITKSGVDVTEPFMKGAREMLELCKKLAIDTVILKQNSPSCGHGVVYDGTFTGQKIQGNGLTAQLLENNGIKVYSEQDYPAELFE
jgi:uncharacterized protein YbbK (DUF523 family)